MSLLRAANIMFGQVDAVEAAREKGLINSLLDPLKYANPEVMNEEKFAALQDAACGALLNMWCGVCACARVPVCARACVCIGLFGEYLDHTRAFMLHLWMLSVRLCGFVHALNHRLVIRLDSALTIGGLLALQHRR